MSFGTNLQFLRKMHRSMTQENLAEIMGVSRQTITKWESDAAYPEMDKLLKLSDFFSCGLDRLLREDMNIARDAYSPIRLEEVEAFKMARYAVVSPAPEEDAQAHMGKWIAENGLDDIPGYTPQVIGWDFPFVSLQQVNVFHMHGYAIACVLPEDFSKKCADMEFANQKQAKYAVITITDPFSSPFDLIPNAYKSIQSYMEINGIKGREDDEVLPCFEKVYTKDGVTCMDVYMAVQEE